MNGNGIVNHSTRQVAPQGGAEPQTGNVRETHVILSERSESKDLPNDGGAIRTATLQSEGGHGSTTLSDKESVTCAVYMMTNRRHSLLYIGVTSDLGERVMQHKTRVHPTAVTRKYNVDQLVYFEMTNDIQVAIARGKQLKGWRRSKKIALIEMENPEWKDLADDWEWMWSL